MTTKDKARRTKELEAHLRDFSAAVSWARAQAATDTRTGKYAGTLLESLRLAHKSNEIYSDRSKSTRTGIILLAAWIAAGVGSPGGPAVEWLLVPLVVTFYVVRV